MKKITAAVNFAATIWASLVGVVVSVSKVPDAFSRANVRMVMTGAVNTMMIQSSRLLKNTWVMGLETGSLPNVFSNVTKSRPTNNASPAMMT